MIKTKNLKIAPSILSANFARLGDELSAIDKTDADYIHLDIMDGSFVPNLTFGSPIIKAIKPFSSKPFDVHLMINNPQNLIDSFIDAGSDIITIHYEACIHHQKILNYISQKGVRAGISLVPSTQPQNLDYLLDDISLILIMSVNPGFGGQEFLYSQLAKIEYLANKIVKLGLDIEISVDGGINETTAELAKNAGANVLVAGNFVFKGNYQEQITKLKNC